uniref:DoxX family protein n=1 Tax=Ascaris lumbricoides TaxID=6252 RepID=A0A0M3HW89_ASCLU
MFIVGLGEYAFVPLVVIFFSFIKFSVAIAATTSLIALTAYFL